jgi:NAD(P)-dependent dehydrogenase (short-subunit alcohol dehydrogenase family)
MTVDHRDLAAVEAALDRCNMIDLLRHVVLLAGIALPEETQLSGGRELPHPTLFQASVELNLLGHVNVIWAVQRLLFSADGDRSIDVCSSVNALQGLGEPAYRGAKAGLIGLVHALTVPYGTRGIRINAVAPGTIDTPNTRAEYVRDPDHFEVMQRGVPLGRLGRPDDVAAVLLALARDMRHVTVQVITVDGGQTIQR